MAGDVEELGARIAGATKTGKPWTTAAANRGRNGDSFDIRDGCWAAEKTDVSGEWRLETGLSLLALERFDKGCFLAADVGPGATMHEHVKVITGTASVFA